MSEHRFLVVVNVIDDLLEEHDGDQEPPPNDITEWEMSDLHIALDEGIVDDIQIVTYEGALPGKD